MGAGAGAEEGDFLLYLADIIIASFEINLDELAKVSNSQGPHTCLIATRLPEVRSIAL